MAQIPERWDPDSVPASASQIVRSEVGSRRQNTMSVFSIVTGTDPLTKNIGQGNANSPSVLTLDSTDASGNVTTNYLWVDRLGKLRIDTNFPLTDTQASSTVVGSQS